MNAYRLHRRFNEVLLLGQIETRIFGVDLLADRLHCDLLQIGLVQNLFHIGSDLFILENSNFLEKFKCNHKTTTRKNF